MTQVQKELLLKDLAQRLPYGVKGLVTFNGSEFMTQHQIEDRTIDGKLYDRFAELQDSWYDNVTIKPYLFPLSSMTEEEYAIYWKISEDAGKLAYLEGCSHHLIINIRSYNAGTDYLLSKHYDIKGLIPKGLAIDATNLNIY